MATLNNFTITSPQNQDILIYSNGSWINSNISGFFGILDGRYSANTHNHDGRYILKADAYTKSQTYPAASLYTKAEIDAMFDGFDPGSGGGGGSGLVNSASNVGSGAGVFHANASGDLQFRSLFSQDIDLLTIAVSGTSVIFTPKVPTWSKLVSANGQLTTSHVNFANQGVNTSSKPSFAGLTVDTGSWSSSGLKLTGAAPSIYFSQNDNSNAYVGINTNSFYVLQDTNSDGSFESPYTLQANLDGTSFRYYGNEVYHAGNKPSWNEVVGKPNISIEGHTHGSIEIQDQRTMSGSDGSNNYFPLPRDIESHTLSTYFGYYNNTGGGWKSSITVKGWSEDYSVWQLIGGASTGQDSMLYFRAGRATTWDTPYAIYHEGHKPSYSEIGVITTSHVNFANQYLNTGSSPTFSNGIFTGELKVENAQPWLRLNDTTGNNARIRNQSNVIYFDADDGNGNATVAVGSLRAGSAFIGAADGPYLYRSNATDHTFAIRTGTSDARKYYVFHGSKSQLDIGGHKVWTAGNDGSGSGLDADLLDGYHADSFTFKPNDHTSNNTDYSIVWENNAGTLYTSTAHLKYNPALRRISAGAVYLSGVNNDMLTLDSTGHANLVIDRASTSYDNNICFKTGGALKWRLWMGAGDDHIAFRHEPSGTQPVAIYERIIGLQGKRAFRFDDSWLRINDAGEFNDGIYCASSILRTDGNLQVGNNGAAFNANTSQIDLKVTTRVHGFIQLKEIRTQDGNYTSIGAGELGNSLYEHVNTTYGAGNEGVHIGGEHGVYLYSHSNNMTGGMDASYSIRILASDGASYLNHLDVYKSQNNSNQVMARFRHPIHNGSIALVSKNNDAGSFRFEANMEGQDLRIQTCDTSGSYFTSGISVGTIARFFRNGNVTIAREVTAQDFIATSDIRVKENLEKIDSSLDKVAKLTGFTYDQIKLKQRKAGLIAQDVKEVLPEAVGEDEDGILNVSPMAVLALLVNAVNDLSEQIKELKENGNV